MSTINRIYDFQPGDPIVSSQFDDEFNQIVDLLNGTSSNRELSVRLNDNSLAPLKVNQVGIGPIADFQVGGSSIAILDNDGSLTLPEVVAGVLTSTVTTGTAPVQVASTTVCPNLNADLLDGIQGSSFVRNNNGAQGVAGDFTITDSSPKLIFADSDGADFEIEVNSDTCVLRSISVGDIWNVAHASRVMTFGAIPVLPGSDPVNANDAVRKSYVDSQIASKRTAFSLSWFVSAPATMATGTQELPKFVCPEGTSITLTKSKIVFSGGNHTSGGDLQFTFQLKTAASSWSSFTNFGSIHLDNTNNTGNVVYEVNFDDVVLSAGDTILCFLEGSSGTITEQFVTISLIGTQALT